MGVARTGFTSCIEMGVKGDKPAAAAEPENLKNMFFLGAKIEIKNKISQLLISNYGKQLHIQIKLM